MSEAQETLVRHLPDVDHSRLPELLPHRYPMLLIDRLIEIEAPVRATGLKNVTFNEPFFQGHFPGDPIMPGVLVVEAMAQAAAALIVASKEAGGPGTGVYFSAIEEARFRLPVRPGDQLRLAVERVRSRLGIYWFTGRATVDGKVAAEAKFSAKVFDRPAA